MPIACARMTAVVVVLVAASAAGADVIWNEPVEGDISDDRLQPTPLVLSPGSNELFGVMSGGDGEIFDRDYFRITVPDGHVLSQIVLGYYFSVDRTAFIAVQPGEFFPNDPDEIDPSSMLGWSHFGPAEVGSDLLVLMGSHGQGFAPPLASGVYTFWAQQSDNYTEYALDFVVETPAPGAAGAFVLGGLCMASRRRAGSKDVSRSAASSGD